MNQKALPSFHPSIEDLALAVEAAPDGPSAAKVLREFMFDRGAGDRTPTDHVIVHRNRLERLECVLDFVVTLATCHADTPVKHYDTELGALVWGIPCMSCGSAETLCCCSIDFPEGPGRAIYDATEGSEDSRPGMPTGLPVDVELG